MAVAWPQNDDGHPPPESHRELSQCIVMNPAPQAPSQIVHRYSARGLVLLGHRSTMVVAPQNRSGILHSTSCINAAESIVSCVRQCAVRPHHKLPTMSRRCLWRPHKSSLGSGPGSFHPCPWLLPPGITSIRTKPLTVTREYPAQRCVADVRAGQLLTV